MSPAALTVDGRTAPDRPQGSEWHYGEKGVWRACYRSSTLQRRVQVYVLGTLIEEMLVPGNAFDARLACDELRLDISQSSVVRGRTLDQGLALLERRAI